MDVLNKALGVVMVSVILVVLLRPDSKGNISTLATGLSENIQALQGR
jgi:hypothetical protein